MEELTSHDAWLRDLVDDLCEVEDEPLVQGELVGGKYRVERRVGAGGMGVVYRARALDDERHVAIKLLRHKAVDRARFDREARVLASLVHPGIVGLEDHGLRDGGSPYLVMRWLEGSTLARRLRTVPPSLADVVAMARELASTLAYLHRRGVVHRDLKPTNILLLQDRWREPALVDFGIALRDSDSRLTRTGARIGTVGYMAPEQEGGLLVVDGRADLFSLGCVLFECANGQPAPARPGATSSSSGMPELDALIDALLQVDPDDRPTGADEVERRLAALMRSPSAARQRACAPRVGGRLSCRIVIRGEGQSAAFDRIDDEARRDGGFATAMPDGRILVSIEQPGDATELITVAAHCALRIARIEGDHRVLLATYLGGTGEPDLPEPVVAPGSVQVDALTAELLAGRFELRREAQAIRLGTPRITTEARRVLGRETPFVGRRRELARLSDAWADCLEEGSAHWSVILGAAGTGKTRLLTELVWRLESEAPFRRVRVGAHTVARSSATHTARAIVRELLSLREEGEPYEAQVLADVVAATGLPHQDLAVTVRHLVSWFGAPSSDETGVTALRDDPTMMPGRQKRVFSNLLTSACEREPLLLIIDDLQWVDMASIDYLATALRRAARSRFMILAAGRPEARARLTSIEDLARPTISALPPLTERSSRQLVGAVLGADAPDDLTTRIIQRAQGNPFFLEELMRASREQGSGDLPETVLATLQARLDALPALERTVLCSGAVLGETFTLAAIAHVLGGPCAPILETLVDGELLLHVGPLTAPGYAFRHSLVHEAVLQSMTDEERRPAHLRSATWHIQSAHPDPAVVAEHLLAAGNDAQAIPWLRRAAERALDAGDIQLIQKHADRAVGAGARGDELAQLEVLRAISHGWSGDFARAMSHLRTALEQAQVGSDAWWTATAVIAFGEASVGDPNASSRIQRVLQHDPRGAARGPIAFALVTVAGAAAQVGNHEEAGKLAKRLGELAALSSEPVVAGWWHLANEVVERYRGHRLSLGLGACQAAIGAFVQAGSEMGEARGRGVLGFWAMCAGQLQVADSELSRSIELAGWMKAGYVADFSSVVQAAVIAALGDAETGVRLLRGFRDHPNRVRRCLALILEAEIEAGRGEPLEPLVALLGREKLPIARAAHAAVSAEIALLHGDRESATRIAATALSGPASQAAYPFTVLRLLGVRLEATHKGAPAQHREEARAILASMRDALDDSHLASFGAMPNVRRIVALV